MRRHAASETIRQYYFGMPWSHRVELMIRVPVPLGESCSICLKGIGRRDQGLLLGMVQTHPDSGEFLVGGSPVHKGCLKSWAKMVFRQPDERTLREWRLTVSR